MINKIITSVLCGLLLVTATPVANAYSERDRIAELQATIIRLQAELSRLQNQSSNWGSSAVTTGDVRNLGRGDVEFAGRLNSTQSGTTRVWFEYGPTTMMSLSTPLQTLSSNRDRSFTAFADNLRANQTYYYRAVADTRSGIREGVTRTFRLSGYTTDWDDDDDDWWDDRDEDEDDRDDEDMPDVTTDDADDVTESRAELNGEVDMNDFEDGLVFFAFGEDEDMVEEVADEDQYRDIDTDGDDLRLVQVGTNFDDDADFRAIVTGLDDDTEHYFRLCVEYENDDDDDTITCGDVESFETDRN